MFKSELYDHLIQQQQETKQQRIRQISELIDLKEVWRNLFAKRYGYFLDGRNMDSSAYVSQISYLKKIIYGFVIVLMIEYDREQLITLIVLQGLYFFVRVWISTFQNKVENFLQGCAEFIFLCYLGMKLVDYYNYQRIVDAD